jgi:class I fructose-bisphosphate aldolase
MKMSNAVESILANYAAENPGVLANLRRLMNHGALAGTGRFVILPVDQGFEHGPARSFAPNPEGYDPSYHPSLALEAGKLSPELGARSRLQCVRCAARFHRVLRA